MAKYDRFAVDPSIGSIIREVATEEQRDFCVVIANAFKMAYPEKFKQMA